MSKSATQTAPKILPKSAWAKGPPQNSSAAGSPRSQSPAPASPGNATPPQSNSHSRRPSSLGQGIPVKDGVSVPRGNVGAVKQGSSVTFGFGSIDDASAPVSSSPATASPLRTDAANVKSFGSVPANGIKTNTPSSSSVSTVSTASNASTAASTPPTSATSTPSKTKPKVDIRKLFQGSGSGAPSPVSSTFPSDSSSPVRSSPVPLQQQQQQPQPGPPHSYNPYTPPPSNLRLQNNANVPNPQRSPAFPRPMSNGNGVRPPGGPNGPGPAPPLPSPRLGPHPHPGQPVQGMPPPSGPQMQVPMHWNGYYYTPMPGYMPGLPQEHYMGQPFSPQWHPHPQQPPPPQQQQHHPQQQQHHPHHQQPPPPPLNMQMSPRNPPPPLQHPPPPQTPPTTASSITSPQSARLNTNLNTNASAFVPSSIPPRPRAVTIKTEAGQEVDIAAFKASKASTPPVFTPSTNTGSPDKKDARRSVRLESEESKLRREADERAAKARKEKEIEEKKAREEKAKQEKEEQEARRKQEEEERRKREEEAARLKEEQEKERVRKEEEEKERIRLENERRKEEEAAKEHARLEEEEKERIRKEEEEKERIRKEEEEAKRLKIEEEEREKAKLQAEEEEKAKAERERQEKERLSESIDKSEESLSTSSPTPTPAPETHKPRRPVPGPLDLSSANRPGLPQPLPSALATARIIDDLGKVPYPEGIKSPKVELNVGAIGGKFKYDRDFLMQFMAVCKEKPDRLPPLDAIGIEPSDQNFGHPIGRGGSGRRQNSISMGPPSSTGRPPTVSGLGFPNIGKGGTTTNSGFAMGNFGKQMEERFASGGRSASASASQLPFANRPTSTMSRSPSLGGPNGVPTTGSMGGRTRSKRGTSDRRTEGNRVNTGGPGASSYNNNTSSGLSNEPVAPLAMSGNRWVASSASRKPPQAVNEDSPEVVDRKVKGLLNKLTMEKFDSISDQIVWWANKSEKEKDGRTLIQVIRLVFEKATDEATWSEMYARLCRKMMEQISSDVQDDGIKNADGNPITGGQLFRKYLLNRCQEDFERGWAAKDAAAAAAASKASEDQATKDAADKAGVKDGEEALYSDEYYASQKAKRRGLGLIKFIGELFKLQMLTERIMHACIKKLLSNVDNPEEEEIESLCKLLITVGQALDTAKARGHMDVYFSRMKELAKSTNVSHRMQFLLQDVIELRGRNWVSRNLTAAPATIAQIHENAAKEKAAQEKEAYNRQQMSRGGSRRGGERGDFQAGPDGWAVAGGPAAARPPAKAGDLSNFGKIAKSQPMTFGPTSVFAGKKDSKSIVGAQTLSRTNSSSNMFSMLSSQTPDANAEPSKLSRPTSTDTAQPEPASVRKKLALLPRSKPVEDPAKVDDTPAGSEAGSEDESTPSMSEAEAKKKINEDCKEFFAVRNIDEAEDYFTKLPPEHRFRLVDKLVASAIESKESDARLVATLFLRASEKDLCLSTSFEEGFLPTAEALDDIAIDAPKAFDLMAIMMNGTNVDGDQRLRISQKSMDSDKLLALLS